MRFLAVAYVILSDLLFRTKSNETGISLVTSNAGHQANFKNPISRLQLFASLNADDFTVTPFESAFAALLTIHGDGGTDKAKVVGTDGIDSFTITPNTPVAGIDIVITSAAFTFTDVEVFAIETRPGVDIVVANSTNINDRFTLRRNGENAELSNGIGQFHFEGSDTLTVNLEGGDDTLLVDFVNGIPIQEVTVNGGLGTNRLQFQNGTFFLLDLLLKSETGGRLLAETEAEFIDLKFSGVNRIESSTPFSVTLVNLADLNDEFIFTDGFESGDVSAWSHSTPNQSARQIPANAPFGIDFRNPSSRLQIFTGGGDDVLTIFRLDAGFDINVNGGSGNDYLWAYPGLAISAQNFENTQDLSLLFLPQIANIATNGHKSVTKD